MTKRILFLFAASMAVSSCQPTKPIAPPTVVITGCEHFSMLTASRSDTKETKTEILAHNTEFKKVCVDGGVKK